MAKGKVRGIKSGPATPVAFVPAAEEPSPYLRAEKLAEDPNMVVPPNNPLATETQDDATLNRLSRYNMERLMDDARLRRKAGTGNVYAGIMNQRFGG